MHVRVGAVGEGREHGQRVELGIQPFSLWKEISQDVDTRKEILLEAKLKRDSKKHANPICAQAVLLKCFVSCFWTPSKFIVQSVWWLK